MSAQLKRLQQYLRDISAGKQVVVAWSGGVDSTLVAAVAQQVLGAALRVMMVDSEFVARCDVNRAKQLAADLSLPLTMIKVSLLSDAGIRSNGKDRCYRCKKRMLAAINEAILANDAIIPGPVLILDGTNAGDDEQRPGRKALEEAGAVSPIDHCGLDKEQVRELARTLGLPNADLVSNSCLATRIQDHALDASSLDRVDKLEDCMMELGFSGIRARLDDLKVIIEIPRESKSLLEQHHDHIKRQIESMNLYLAGYGWR